jgi:uncharacterized lipoprotein
MKKTIQLALLLTCAVTLLAGCVTDNGKLPQPTAGFVPKRTYAVPYDKLWTDVLNALDKNKVTIAAIDKSSGVIQSDYLAGPGTFMVIMAQSTRYKYNITVRDQGDGNVRVNVTCKVESSINGDRGADPYRDVTPQNAALTAKLETWLYEQIEQEIK